MRAILDAALDFLFPLRCSGCMKEGTYLCAACRYALPRAVKPADAWASALYDYRHRAVREALWKLKYRGVAELSAVLGESLYEALLADIAETRHWKKATLLYLVPVPLTPTKERARGFNQAKRLCEAILSRDREGLFAYLPDALRRTKDAKSQMSIKNRAARLKNAEGAFEVAAPELVEGKNIILIDDIITTGATLRDAHRALVAAGALDIRALTVAH